MSALQKIVHKKSPHSRKLCGQFLCGPKETKL